MDEQSHSGFHLSEAFVADMSDADSRTIFAADQLRMRVAMMIRALREQRGWTQTQLAERMNTKQPVISRIEDGEYGKLSVQTLLDVAAAFDLPLYIDLPEWGDWFALTRDFSDENFQREGFQAESLIQPKAAIEQSPTGSALAEFGKSQQTRWNGLTVIEGGGSTQGRRQQGANPLGLSSISPRDRSDGFAKQAAFGSEKSA